MAVCLKVYGKYGARNRAARFPPAHITSPTNTHHPFEILVTEIPDRISLQKAPNFDKEILQGGLDPSETNLD
jgi:hypothetical protein